MTFIRKKSKPKTHSNPSKRFFNALRTVIETLAIVLILRLFVVEAHAVPTGSMIPTIQPGEYLLAEKISYRLKSPKQGDVIVFEYPVEQLNRQDKGIMTKIVKGLLKIERVVRGQKKPGGGVDYVKRCIATEGQILEIRDRKVFIDSVQIEDPHANFVNELPPVPDYIGIPRDKWQEIWESRDLFTSVIEYVRGKPEAVVSYYGFVAAFEANQAGISVESGALVDILNGVSVNGEDWNSYLRGKLTKGFEMILGEDYSEDQILPIINKALDYDYRQLVYWSIADNFPEITVPEGHVFGMGDNRDQSADSRFWGPVPVNNVKGRPVILYYSVEVQPPKPGKTPTILDNILILITSFFRPGDIRIERFFTFLF